MSDAGLEVSLAEYRQRQSVQRLRHALYSQPDPSASPDLVRALAQAEEELRRLENQRQANAPPDRGVLLDTRRQGEQAGGIMLGAETTGVEARVLLRMSHVPTGLAHLLNAHQTPLVTFHLQNARDQEVRLRLTSFVEGYSAQAIDTIELPGGESVPINQLPTFFPERIRSITEMTRATLHIRIDNLDGPTEQQSTFAIWLLARTSAYNAVRDPVTGEWIDLTPYYAAWVTPNAPEVMRVLRRAAELHPRHEIVGYQGGKQQVEAQVAAIYDALKAEQITYVHSAISFGSSGGESMQRVRLPRESLETKSANCVDGTVLMASVMEAASLNPAIVAVPSHAFVGWETLADSGEWDYVETTMISTSDFEAAHQAGRNLAANYQERADKLADPWFFQRFSVAELRVKRGITPME